jgi:hypothetical protein
MHLITGRTQYPVPQTLCDKRLDLGPTEELSSSDSTGRRHFQDINQRCAHVFQREIPFSALSRGPRIAPLAASFAPTHLLVCITQGLRSIIFEMDVPGAQVVCVSICLPYDDGESTSLSLRYR